MADAPDRPIVAFEKNHREKFDVRLRSYRGRRFVDLRVWATNSKGGAAPTRNGIGFKPPALRKVIEALQAAEIVAREEGLL